MPSTHMHLHEPIWGRLQSSYDNVNAELFHIRRDPLHSECTVVFFGCDGLGYSRLIHRLSQDPTQFLETAPVVIPQLGTRRSDRQRLQRARTLSTHPYSSSFSQWLLAVIAAGGPGY
eukprot:3936375-Pleurochrysis_carterae.AAC.1